MLCDYFCILTSLACVKFCDIEIVVWESATDEEDGLCNDLQK